jgi:cell division protein FtsZ
MGIGSSRGDDRAVAAAEMAISSPLLEASIDGAHGVLLSIQGGSDLGLFEINEAAQLVSNSAAVDANIIFGAVIDDALGDEVRVTVIAAGFDENQMGYSAPAVSGLNTAVASERAPAPSQESAPLRPASGPSNRSGPTLSSYAATPVASSYVAPTPAQGSPVQASQAKAGEQTMAWSAADEAASSVTASPVVAGSVIKDEEPPVTASEPAGESPAETVDAAGTTAEDAGGSEAVSSDSSAHDSASHKSASHNSGDHEAPASGSVPSQATASSHGASSSNGGSTGRTFDVPTTRRRPVIFEEDDDLDVPDFLK